MLSILVALALAGLISGAFMQEAKLTGSGNEDSLYLIQLPGIHVDLHGLLLGGMIIGWAKSQG